MPTNSLHNNLVPATSAPVDFSLIEKIVPLAKLLNYYHQYEIVGLDKIPKKGKALVLVNHSLATYDAFLLGANIYLELGRYPKGLADHNFFKFEKIGEMANKIGMVEATPENAHALLHQGELVMLAPGGMREALRPSDEKYQIRWSNRRGFAKLAIETQTPIYLAACPMADELYLVYKSWLTKQFYKKFKFPFVLARGLGFSLIPRPIKLTHFISEPLYPPALVKGKRGYAKGVRKFQEEVIKQMNELMKSALQE